MQAPSETTRTRARGLADQLGNEPLGPALGLAVLAICALVDSMLDSAGALVDTYVAAPLVTAFLAGPLLTLAIGLLAVVCALASPLWNADTGTLDQLVGVAVIVFGTGLALFGSWLRGRSRERSERLGLLDAVGSVADGSLPLAETLGRVVEVIVPAFADACMVDAVHDGGATRIATRVAGRADASELERRLHERAPSLPRWLVRVERPWRRIPRWWPRVHHEHLRRMAHSPEDLEFLRSLGIRSVITVPIRARDRNLGALTAVSAWSRRRYAAEDVRFAQILASRIGLALDNAGLFSDLESIERRMDTVMSILDEAVVIHGIDGELVFANPAAARTLGYETSEEAVASPSSRLRERLQITDESGRPLGADALSGRRARGGAGERPQAVRVTDRASGRERWVRTKSRTIEGPGNEVLYSVTAIEDVTDVKRAEFANRLLARIGELLSHSADYALTLQRVPQLLVPEFADWCVIEVPGDESDVLEPVASAHREPARLERVASAREIRPSRLVAGGRREAAVRRAEPQLFEVDDEYLRGYAADDEHLRELRGLGLRSAMVVPMVAGGVVVGALELLNHDGSRSFDDYDLTTAAELGRRAGLALENARIADERARIADALQRELLPPTLPRMAGWEVATMYEPAGEVNQVGGDFYEVFPVEAGWAVVLGDVSGRGAAAAALTAEARHTIRTAGLLSDDPCRGLYLLDEHLRGRPDAALCSVALLILPERATGPESEIFVYLAGHPHPVLLRDGRAEAVGEPGPLLGIVDEPSWDPVPVRLRPGEQLVLYTDGVIEARRASGERYGTERLLEALAGCATPELAVARVRAALAGFGARAREDDAAVVAIRLAELDPALGEQALPTAAARGI